MKIFLKHRRTQPSDKSLALGEEVVVSLIGGDQVEIKVRVGISRVPGIGAAEKSSHNPLICLASCDKAVHDDLVVLRQLYFLRIHSVPTVLHAVGNLLFLS